MFGPTQLILYPTRITCNSSSIIDHILINFPNSVTQQGILNAGLSDHQLISCTRKTARIKRDGHEERKFCSLKNYTVDGFEKALVNEVKFPNYEDFDDA